MKFRSSILTVAALTLAVALTACGSSSASKPSSGGSTTNDLGGKTVTIAVENAYPPFNYVNKDTNKAEGWDYDTWRAICKKINCKPVFKEAAFDGMIQAVSEGQFDAAADGITITPDRAKAVAFSKGYIKVEQRLMVKKGETRFATLADFKSGKFKVGTQTGTTNFETAAKEYGGDRVSGFETFALATQALLNSDVDAVIIDDTAGQGYVGQDREKLELLPGSISSDDLGFIYPKGSDLVGPVNFALTELENSGELKKINDRFFAPDFQAPVAG
jgi:polar amino acid transport system substrate-binding protein